MLKRQASNLNTGDLLLVVIVADAAQNGMSGDYKTITEGLILVGTLFFWDYIVDLLSYRFPGIHRFVYAPRLPLVHDGKPILRNLRKEFLTQDELVGEMHQQGIEKIADVKEAFLEGSGKISFIPRKK